MADGSELFAGLELRPDLRQPVTQTQCRSSASLGRKLRRLDLQKVRTDAIRKNIHTLRCALEEDNIGINLSCSFNAQVCINS
jgi:hypothetical protein